MTTNRLTFIEELGDRYAMYQWRKNATWYRRYKIQNIPLEISVTKTDVIAAIAAIDAAGGAA